MILLNENICLVALCLLRAFSSRVLHGIWHLLLSMVKLDRKRQLNVQSRGSKRRQSEVHCKIEGWEMVAKNSATSLLILFSLIEKLLWKLPSLGLLCRWRDTRINRHQWYASKCQWKGSRNVFKVWLEHKIWMTRKCWALKQEHRVSKRSFLGALILESVLMHVWLGGWYLVVIKALGEYT